MQPGLRFPSLRGYKKAMWRRATDPRSCRNADSGSWSRLSVGQASLSMGGLILRAGAARRRGLVLARGVAVRVQLAVVKQRAHVSQHVDAAAFALVGVRSVRCGSGASCTHLLWRLADLETGSTYIAVTVQLPLLKLQRISPGSI